MADFSVTASTGSSSMDRAEELTGTRRSPQRYPSGDDISLEDVSDPHLTRDETSKSWRQWVADHPGWTILGSAFTLVVLGIAASLGAQLFPAIIGNVWVQRIGVATALVGGAYVAGRRQQQSAYRQMDTLTLRLPDGVRRFHGTLETSAAEDYPVFTPVKGWSWLGNPGEPYSLDELSNELPLNEQASNYDGSAEARIGLHPSFAAAAKTGHGGVVAQLTRGLETYPWGRSFNIRAGIPETAEKSRISDMRQRVESAEQEVHDLEQENNQLRRQRNNAYELAKESFEGHIDMFTEQLQKASKAFNRDRTSEEETDEDVHFALEEDLDVE